ncbi:hypothetical protein J2S00_003050 [Caldalkalibacillus uzonensis]|uniref:Uncharacterized protein n=1 Tax=Caldalkalibacillus uzonensis TaxID=353224 RepID=A0ABU0CXA2_9BACI|nr:hypothetical protein [Caldalkalibacillus uzonensis]MDQ0340245.1 hypothetical protein [Caldalkalibacillus uzonensis]
METNTVLSLADQLLNLREAKEDLESRLKEINKELEKVENELVEQMRVNELERFNFRGKLFYQQAKTWASPKKEHKEYVYQWLKENGYADLVKETVHSQSFSSLINEMLEEEGEVPDDLMPFINLTEKVGIRVRKG